MSENEKCVEDGVIAAMLNDVSACGMEIDGLEHVFADYFTVLPSNADSDSDAEESLIGM